MKKIFFIFALLPVLLFCSCSITKGSLEYQNFAANAEITIKTDNNTVRANISLGAPNPDSSPRDAKITFSSPDSLSGIVVARKGGEVFLSIGSLTLPAENHGFIGIADLFSIKGTLSSAELCTLDGKKATHITITDTDAVYDVYISENDLPLRIVKDCITVDVVWFEREK